VKIKIPAYIIYTLAVAAFILVLICAMLIVRSNILHAKISDNGNSTQHTNSSLHIVDCSAITSQTENLYDPTVSSSVTDTLSMPSTSATPSSELTSQEPTTTPITTPVSSSELSSSDIIVTTPFTTPIVTTTQDPVVTVTTPTTAKITTRTTDSTTRPITTKPITTKPVTTKPVTTKPVTTKPVTTKPVTTPNTSQTTAPITTPSTESRVSTATSTPVTTPITTPITTDPTPTPTPTPTPEDKIYPNPINEEIRGIWVATVYRINFPSKNNLSAEQLKKEIDNIVISAKNANCNTIMFQVRPASDALYNSNIFPTSVSIVENEGDPLPDGFDPLAYIIEKAHSEGIKLHAWINPYRITLSSSQTISSLADGNPAKLHPEWTLGMDKGSDYRIIYNPGIPDVRKLIADGVAEIVRNYDVDGIVFDDYFYIHHDNFKGDVGTYNTYGAEYDTIEDFRRGSVNEMVKLVYNTIKSIDPGCIFGVSPRGVWQNKTSDPLGSDTQKCSQAYHDIYCDAVAWIKGGYIDYISPQIYWSTTSVNTPFYVLADWWNGIVMDTDVALIISVSASSLGKSEIAKQLAYCVTQSEYGGFLVFGYENTMKASLGYIKVLVELGAHEINKKYSFSNITE